ncbi:MAG TPA: polysaccharide biosynthesis/export family protein [Fibrobacteria bacterium]|nr:polysaccharide biosynthesis/export family protein [Fibrobacteria bacterium]
MRIQRAFLLALAAAAALSAAGKERDVPEQQFLPGEAIRIDIPADTSTLFDSVYAIDGEGMADLPIAGRIVVAGKTRENIEQYLSGLWAPYLKDTHIKATPNIRIAVTGNVRNPGFYFASHDAPAYDVIKMAGGPLLPYDLDEIEHRRAGETLNDELAENISRGQTLREAGLASGDEIMVPIVDRVPWPQVIPLVGMALGVVINAITIWILVAQN